jgi:hypothetical protein
LNDHFGDSEPIRGTELANMVAWRNAERLAARYGGDYRDIIKFLKDSELRRRRFAPVIMPLFGLAVLSISLIFGIGILSTIFGSSQRSPMAVVLRWHLLGIRGRRIWLRALALLWACAQAGGARWSGHRRAELCCCRCFHGRRFVE